MNKPLRLCLTLAALSLSLQGCFLNGLGASSSYSCEAPDGVSCASVSGINANAEKDNLQAIQETNPKKTAPAGKNAAKDTPNLIKNTPSTGTPVRIAPRILRVWVAPYVDSEGDLRDQSYTYINVDPGRWLIESTQEQIRSSYAPIKAPKSTTTTNPPSPPPPGTTPPSLIPQILQQSGKSPGFN